MNIQKALTLKVNDKVKCPSDRGDSGYVGKVTHISETVERSFHGEWYIWVTVERDSNTKHVWPSNRLA